MAHMSFLVFAAAYLAVVLLPGPGVTALVARVLAQGPAGAPAFIAGFVLGSLTWFTIAATGLAVVANSFAAVFVAIRYAGAAYLVYLAWKLWRAAPRPTDVGRQAPVDRGRLFLTGLAINLGNPKVIVFFLALLPTVVDVATLDASGFAALAVTVAVIASLVLTAYAAAASQARRLLATPRTLRLVNRGSSVVMAGRPSASRRVDPQRLSLGAAPSYPAANNGGWRHVGLRERQRPGREGGQFRRDRAGPLCLHGGG